MPPAALNSTFKPPSRSSPKTDLRYRQLCSLFPDTFFCLLLRYLLETQLTLSHLLRNSTVQLFSRTIGTLRASLYAKRRSPLFAPVLGGKAELL